MFEEIVALRLKVLSKIKGFQNLGAMGKVLGDYFQAIDKYKITDTKLIKVNDRLIGYLIASRFFHKFYGHVLTQYIIDYDPDHKEVAIPQLAQEISELGNEGFCLIELYSPCFDLFEEIDDQWRVAAVSYGGNPEDSLAMAKEKSLGKLNQMGLVLEPASSLDQIEAIMALKLDSFRKNEELCWYWKCDQFQTQEFMRLVKSLSQNESFVVLDGEKVVGYAGLSFDPHNPYWGASCGIDLVLKESLHGQGLSYSLYEYLFEEMKKRGAVFYKGATANTSVISAAKSFGRWPLYYQILPQGFSVK